MFAIAVLGITLATVGVVWSTQLRREKEEQLLFVGNQFRVAIGRYVRSGGQYPLELADLVEDQRTQVPRRFLRRIYPDPMTGSADWQLIQAPQGGIMGIASTSQGKPIKVAHFSLVDESFEKAECYCDWKFIYMPRAGRNRRVIRPAGQP
jgi:type II secretory pathway pseudopilin PulG